MLKNDFTYLNFLGNRAESSILALLSEPRGEREQSQADMGSQSLPRSLQLGDRCLLLGVGGYLHCPGLCQVGWQAQLERLQGA